MSLDDEVMRALIHQVSKAVPEGGSERDVLTFVTRPMWRMWCRAVGLPEEVMSGSEGLTPISMTGHPINCVYGSFTVIVESDRVESGSTAFRHSTL